jgi:hypothetical protein
MSTEVPQEPVRPERLRPDRRRYRQAKGRPERSGMGVRESEHPIVPRKQGQPPERPCGGTEVPGHGTVGGNDGGEFELQNCLNET